MGGGIALRVALNHPKKVRRLVLAATSAGLDVTSLGAVDWRPDYRQEYRNAASWIMDERPDLTHELSKISQPTLLLWGENDPISPLAVGQRFLQLLPNANLKIISQGDHAFVHDRPDDILRAIKRHLE